MVEYKIIEPDRTHILALAPLLRDGDRRELAVAKVSPARAVWRCFRHSLYRRAVIVEGEIAAAWGVGSAALSDTGEIWLLTGRAIERIPVSFVREGLREVQTMLSLYPRLEGIVACDYPQAIKFLSALGFSLHPGEPFFTFSMER